MAETTVNLPQGLLKSPSFQLERLRRRTRTHVEAALSAKDFNLREYWVLTYLVDGDAASQ
ncbi:MAG: MarR family transcriptional regulator, partial [Corynebacterium sp.]|nr:MarR family transcriptional regulator [Corynebacterium sp.]